MLNSGGSLLIGSGDKKKLYTRGSPPELMWESCDFPSCPADELLELFLRDSPWRPSLPATWLARPWPRHFHKPFHWPLMSNDSPTWVDVKITSAQLDEEQLNSIQVKVKLEGILLIHLDENPIIQVNYHATWHILASSCLRKEPILEMVFRKRCIESVLISGLNSLQAE